MNRFAIFSSIFLLSVALVGCGESGPSGPTMRAGAAVADITPQKWPVPVIGGFGNHPATSAHDPLSARALVLHDGTTELAVVVVDSCFIRRATIDDAKQRASSKTGIPTDKILVSATHTHSAPPSSPDIPPVRWEISDEMHANDAAYSELLKDGIAQAIADAQAKLQPARLGRASASVPEELHNRRWFMKEGTIPPDPFGGTTDKVKMNPPRNSPDLIKPAGPTDPEVAMITVETPDGKPLAALAAYSLHYVGGVENGEVSADYFAVFANKLKEKLGAGDDFVAMMANGTSGDVNNLVFQGERPSRERYEQMGLVGERVADAAAAAWPQAEWMEDPTLAMVQREMTLQRRKPTPEIYEQSQKWLKVEDEDSLPRNAKAYAQRAIDLQEGPDTVNIILQAIRVGDVGIASSPFETFTQIGLDIKEKSPLKRSFMIELANGGEGYLPTPEQHELGGYETWLGTNRVQKDASVKMTTALLEMLGEVAKP